MDHDETVGLSSVTTPVRSGPAEPVRSAERVAEIDVVRGLAVLGILVVNLQMYVSPMRLDTSAVEWWTAPWDRFVESAITVLARGKFYSLFSFLFGVGLAIQMRRAERRGAPVASFFARRMLVLLAIGLVHALLIWYGDILVMYAIVGLLLIPFRAVHRRTLVTWAIVLISAPVLLLGLGGAGVRVAMLMPGSGDDLQATFESSAAEAATSIAQTTEAYATGGFAEVFAERAREWGRMIGFGMFFAGPQLLALFLLGYALGRSGFARRLDEEAPRIVHWLPRLAAAGLLGSLLMVVAELFSRPDLPTLLGWLGLVGMMFGAPALALAYASGLVLLMREPAWRRRLARLGAVGRMALTNYLTHSLVVTTLAYGYGGGLYGKISPAAGVPIVVAIFGFQLGFSPWWLARFRFGPVEWLWRSLTYGERQPMRRQTALETP